MEHAVRNPYKKRSSHGNFTFYHSLRQKISKVLLSRSDVERIAPVAHRRAMELDDLFARYIDKNNPPQLT